MTPVVAHAGGIGWDELLVFAAPVLILIVLQVLGRRRARDEEDREQDGSTDEGEA